jgi:hypothetical protein
MAFSKATTVKYVKAVGKFDEAEITEALMDLNQSDVKVLYDLTKKMHMKLKSAHTEAVNSRKAQSKQQTNKNRQQEKLRHMILQIELALDRYEATDAVDKWNISFPVGKYYGNETLAQIKSIHEQLLEAGSSINKLRLLNFVERGRLYDFLKNKSEERHGKWNEVCDQLHVCRRTVDRYIDFFLIIETYPRLIICDQSFELLMTNYKQLNDYFNEHDSLAAKLKMPLKTSSVAGGGTVVSSHRLPGGKNEPQIAPDKLESEGFPWDPAWQVADELFSSI